MEIIPKKFNFNLTKYWFNNNKLKTFFWNANSILFEQSEYIFCKIISFYGKKIDDEVLRNELKILFGQESWHSFNHKNFNEQISKNYSIDKITNRARLITGNILTLRAKDKLSYAVCFEEMIVRICKLLLTEKFTNTDKEVADFWVWHTQDEIEHGYVGKKLYKSLNYSSLINRIHMIKLYMIYFSYIIFSIKEFYKQDIKNETIKELYSN